MAVPERATDLGEKPDKMGELIKNVSLTLHDIFNNPPIKAQGRLVKVEDIRPDKLLDPTDIESQLQAKLNEQTWGVPIRGTVSLIDEKSGKVISKSRVNLLKLPQLTNRYSFIVDGGEYQVDHLLRLRSGVYTRVRRNGNLLSEFTLKKGGAKNFDIELDRKHSIFQYSPKSGSAHVPIYPLLSTLGISDEEMEKHWGKQVFGANKISSPEIFEKQLQKFYEKTGGDMKVKPSLEDLKTYVYNHFHELELNPDSTRATLGHAFNIANGPALLASSHKLLRLERGEIPPDDRDSLIFKEIVHVEDLIPQKLDRSRSKITSKIRLKLGHKDTISEILQGGDVLRQPVTEFFAKGGNVSERPEQTNPIQMLSGHFKTTIIAKDYGGIKSADTLGDEMRAVNPSHFGFLDPMHTPESERTGITLHLGSGVQKTERTLKTQIYDLKTGKTRWSAVPEFHDSTVVLPDQVEWKGGKPTPIAPEVKVKLPGGDIGKVPFHKADFILPSAKSMFSFASNLIPFLPCDQGNRASMADKQMEQAISLKHREEPMVQSVVHPSQPNKTFESVVGSSVAATKSHVAGKVVKVESGSVHISDGKSTHKVALYDNFPLNDPSTMFHSEPLVKVGDHVEAGQVIADTNFTKKGTLALGANLRVGYLPYKGYNYEDGVVISETAAKKFTSEHLHKMKLDIDPVTDKQDLKLWTNISATTAAKMPKEHWDALDQEGVIKVGTRVMPGQLLAANVAPNKTKSVEMEMRFGPSRAGKPWKDKSLYWDSDFAGVVTRVQKAGNGESVQVFVKTEEPAEIGDKLSGRHGNKGIITKILRDEHMPFTVDSKTGQKRPLDVILNPSGVPTRMNVGQVLETAAAKIAEKTGKTYVVNNFAGANHDYRKQVLEDLKKHGLTDEEQVFDPSDVRKPLGSVLVGPQYLLKLKHKVDKKLSVRGGGTDLDDMPYGYDRDRQPYQGGPRGGQGFGALELYSLLGHNARANIREMSSMKSDQQSPNFWRAVIEGREPPPPKTPFSYEKFESYLRGMGVDVRKEGTSMRLVPMNDAEVLQLAGNGKNEITRPNYTVMSKTYGMKEEKGGLFDKVATGGLDGKQWSFIRLAEPLPNPIFVGDKQNKGPIPALLSLKHGNIGTDEIDAIMSGKQQLNGKIGGKAILDALKEIDVDAEIKRLRSELPSRKGSKRDQANRTLRYLTALKEVGKAPHEAYVLKYIPVIPPIFRPMSLTHTGDVSESSLNKLYKFLGGHNDDLRNVRSGVTGETSKNDARSALWNNFKALHSVGVYDPILDPDAVKEQRPLKGFVDLIGGGPGEQPKQGYFQEHLVKRKQDLSIRSTIVPEPNLHLDEVGLPLHAAMELYKPFVVGHLHKRYGYKPSDAMRQMQKYTDTAKQALQEVMNDRPLLLKRDPALHKFSVMAFRPVIKDGKAIKIHPLVCGGFNADFDGDTMAGTVPVTREAVDEAKKMFPTANLFSPTHFGPMHVPNQEFLLGLHLSSIWGAKSGKKFSTIDEAKKAHASGKIELTDVIELKDAKGPTTVGRLMIAQSMPDGFSMNQKILHDPTFNVSKGVMQSIVEDLARNHQPHFNDAINKLKDLGTERSFRSGFSIGLKDFAPLPERDKIVADGMKKAQTIKSSSMPLWEKEKQLVSIWEEATKKIEDATAARLPREGNRLGQMVFSGSRGKRDQLRQMVAAPMLVQDATGRTVPDPVTKSYGEGLDIGDYWLSQHGARKGTLQRSRGTSEPGAMTKDIINSTISTLIATEDCGTKSGTLMSLDPEKNEYHRDMHGRFLARPYGKFGMNDPITPEMVSALRKELGKSASIAVRSPLHCRHGDGICAKCYGMNEFGKLHPIGTNIGIIAGQALGEPATQLAMDSFHTGGVAAGRGGSSVSKIERLKQLLKMPKTLPGSAVLSKVTGNITAVKKDPGLGGHTVMVENVPHHVRPLPGGQGAIRKDLLALEGKVGLSIPITKGDSLSHEAAPVHPKELLAITKDMPKVQQYLVDELYQKLYKQENVRPRNVELVVRALTNYTRVKDPGTSHWEPGDVVSHSLVEEHNRSIHGLPGEKPVLHEAILHGSSNIPRLSTDWMARLNYQRLGETLQRGASMAWRSDIHGSHPIPGIAYGKEFGKPAPTVTTEKAKYVY